MAHDDYATTGVSCTVASRRYLPVQAQSNEADDWETVAEGMTTPSAAKAAAFKASSADTSPNSKKYVLIAICTISLEQGKKELVQH